MPVSLNVDLGEHDDESDELVALAHLANVACGGHAGDDASMARVLRLASVAGTAVAAHPSYEDREGFGRRSRFQPADVACAGAASQCAALVRLASRHGVPVRVLKPHGALYHDAARDPLFARGLVDAALRAMPELDAVVGPAGSELERATFERRLRFLREGFADRGYDPSGALLPRGAPGALLSEVGEVLAQATRLARGGGVDTLCLHGDSPGALERARALRKHLELEGLSCSVSD
jgi:UPF0271 protein